MIRVILSSLVLGFGFFGLIFSAWLTWESDYLSLEIQNANLVEVKEKINKKIYPSLVSMPLKLLLQRSVTDPNIDPASSLEILHLYLKRNPLDANAWLYGSQFYHRLDDIKAASLYLAVAHRLSETNTLILRKVFNRYIELGLIDPAILVAHDIAVSNPGEFRRLFFLMGRLSDDYERLANELIPKEILAPVLIGKGFSNDNNIYYDWALTDAIRSKNTSLANEVWKIIPPSQKHNSALGVRYLNYLSDLQKIKIVKRVWEDVVSNPAPIGRILNQGDDESSPCWQVKKNNNIELSVIRDEGTSPTLKLNFLGEANVNLNHLNCLILVQPSIKYKLTGRYKTKNISTLSGLFVDVLFPGMKEGYSRTESVLGNSPWTDFEMVFGVPDGAYLARVGVRRLPSKLLDSKISGTAWFDSLELTEVINSDEVNNDFLQ